MTLKLLLAHADDGRPVLDRGLAVETLQRVPPPEPLHAPKRLWDASGDPNVLPRQRWGLVAPAGPVGERLLALVEPLRRMRQESQGAPVRVYRVSSSMDGPTAARWKKRVFRHESVPEEERPRYLLLLGDLDQVSLELQQVLSSDAFVGRLAFSKEADYEAYVAKVLRWEETPASESRARLLFYTPKDGTSETGLGHQLLIEPCVAACRERQRVGGFPEAEVLELLGGEDAPTEALLARAAEPGPSVLFSLSHGLGAPRDGWESPERQRELQGALLLPGGRHLSGAELASRPFLPGGIWFCFACYGAGTPARSLYAPWLRQLAETDELAASVLDRMLPGERTRPFIAALPRAVLANPEGPLAVMGHVDLAWSTTYNDQGRGTPSRFLGILQALAEGRRVGVALSTLLRFFTETSLELTSLGHHEETERLEGRWPSTDPVARAWLWMLRQDLAGFILLGDPAVRLPLAPSRVAASTPDVPVDAVSALLGFRGAAPAAAPRREPTDVEAAILYRAAGRAALARHLSRDE